MRFTNLYEELKFDDVFPVASSDEVAVRKSKYESIKIKEILDDAKKTKLPDGTWHVHGGLDVSMNDLTSLKDLHVSIIDAHFICSCNKLTNLEGAPKKVGQNFECSYNKLTSLEGAQIDVGLSMFCDNNNLTNVHGSPSKVGRVFDCSHNKLTALDGAPKQVFCFSCEGNTKNFTKADVRAVCDVKGSICVE